MLFYRVEATILAAEPLPQPRDREAYRTFVGGFAEKSESDYQNHAQSRCFFATGAKEYLMTFGAIFTDIDDVKKAFSSYAKSCGLKTQTVQVEEVTFDAIKSMLRTADRADFIKDDDDILKHFEIDRLGSRYGSVDFGEAILDTGKTKEQLLSAARELLADDTLSPEIERIFQGRPSSRAKEHPVHYLLRCDEKSVRKDVCRVLLEALYANGRIQSRRFCYMDFSAESGRPDASYDALYKSCEMGAVLVRYDGGGNDDGPLAKAGGDVIVGLCDTALKYRNTVLTVFCLPAENAKVKEAFLENLRYISLIELYEDRVSGEKARAHLQTLAGKANIRADKKLYAALESDGKPFTASELNQMFSEWYDKKLRTTVFPQYKDTATAKHELAKARPKGSAIEELNQMVGLKAAKDVIQKALSYYKLQQMYKDRGICQSRPAMHMVFSGNPGTAKTTVARLFAQIMRDNGVLSKGNLYEVGRSDLVGKYVGWTAQIVKEKFLAARGSVLFIDEAYSLVDDSDRMYGDEAINTIVQEMENNRDNMIVIFAGYPDRMEQFLRRNPGLRSRIAFHVPFDDYSTAELVSIADLIAKGSGIHFTDAARDRLTGVLGEARCTPDFGNGRYVRNVIELAKLEQANRIVKMDCEKVTSEVLHTLIPDDIVTPLQVRAERSCRIGFI